MHFETRRVRPPRIFAAVVFLLGAAFVWGGIRLMSVGGSLYYLIAGLVLLGSGLLLWRGNRLGSWLYGALLAGTLIWSLWEVGWDVWALVPRLAFLTVVGLWLLMPWTRRRFYVGRAPALFGSRRSRAFAMLLMLGVGASMLLTREPVLATTARPTGQAASAPASDSSALSTDWRHYGNSAAGTRFARIDQITPSNVGSLKKIWHYRTKRAGQFKATPLQVGDSLFVCTAYNVVVALDAETGKPRWEFDPQVKAARFSFTEVCRGVSYHRAPDDYAGTCPERIITATTDARMFAINARTGERCADFGTNGEISLLPGLGEVKPGFYFVTSPPLIARNLAVVGGWVVDNVEVNEPSGVVRAYDVTTGQFKWAWDMGRPGINTEPAPGETYTRGTPNVWSVMSYDDTLGLIYAPTGNSTPDYFGAHRNDASEKYASSVVALDVNDGSVRWSYQTVHHDIWDYDVPSQPVLVDLPRPDGQMLPALVQATKRGELFLLDRRTGTPVAEVEERPVPQGAVAGDWVAPTQPFSVGMPNFRGDDLSEADMWGVTPFDQLWCRIEFHKLRYEGHFTPPSVQGTLQQPGNAGGFNWGSVAIDEDQKLMVLNPLIMSNVLRLYPRDQIPEGMRVSSQTGTPYGMTTRPFMSPLMVPCQKPPYGSLAVVDLQTREVVWKRSIGTTNESGPLGMRIRLRLPMGVPQQAGTLVTKGGLIFLGGTMDRYFRAMDLNTGKELWRDYLPGTAQATPMSYVSPASQRQIVILTVPSIQRKFGYPQQGREDDEPEDPEGGHIIAYALN